MGSRNLQQTPGQKPVHHHTSRQTRNVDNGIDVKAIQLQDILTRLNRALPVLKPLLVVACKLDAAQRIRCDSARAVPDGHGISKSEEHAHDVDGEACVAEECIEHDTETLTAGYDAETGKDGGEVERCCAGEINCDDGQHTEDQATYQLKGDLEDGVGSKKSIDTVDTVIVLSIEYIALARIDGFVVKGGKEESQDKSKTDDLHQASDNELRLTVGVDKSAMEEERKCGSDRGPFTDEGS
ncbi:hypothetical protein HG531_010857 [Fusarium graminearum]|nr:hypothetical protein HG531_010857 [Fusarium graminearum]